MNVKSMIDILTAVAFATVLIFTVPVLAADAIYSNWQGAIAGYDPVAYHTAGKPVKGVSNFTTEWKGAKWYFVSAENRDRFAAEPEKFAPQYGGYCAYGVAKGSAVKIDPEAWYIVRGKLYLNYSKGIQKIWEGNQADYIAAADKNWPNVLN